ncbi:MAG: energy transducer TonB [Alistipes sp.]|nr:energy transducer TonB [Alistipes sp.]
MELVLALLLVFGAFSNTNKERKIEDIYKDEVILDEEIVEIIRQDKKLDEPDEEGVFIKVEQMPSFQGGDLNTFCDWVQSNVKYPQVAQENGISGRVAISFVVEIDGSLSNLVVLQSPDSSLTDETIRVLKMSPKWKPGKQRNKAVRVRYTIPVYFRIQN